MSETSTILPLYDDSLLYDYLQDDCYTGEGLNAPSLEFPEFRDLLASAARNPTITSAITSAGCRDRPRRVSKRRREPEQAFLSNIKRFVRSGPKTPPENCQGLQQPVPANDQPSAIQPQLKEGSRGEKSNGNTLPSKSAKNVQSNKQIGMAQDLKQKTGSPVSLERLQTATKQDSSSEHQETGAQAIEPDIKNIFLDKIKEGMAQLLAEYTWPWYEQNAQLFRSLYNVHLLNDVALAKRSSNAPTPDK